MARRISVPGHAGYITGFRAWKVRPMSQRQRDDMVILAHIREQHRLSLQSYGRPRMTEELQELGVNVGHPTARQWFACKP